MPTQIVAMHETVNFSFYCSTVPLTWSSSKATMSQWKAKTYTIGGETFSKPVTSILKDALTLDTDFIYPYRVWRPDLGIGFVLAGDPSVQHAPGVIAFCSFTAFDYFDCDLSRILAECQRLLALFGVVIMTSNITRIDTAFDFINFPDDIFSWVAFKKWRTTTFQEPPTIKGDSVRYGTKNLMEVSCYPKLIELRRKRVKTRNAPKEAWLRLHHWPPGLSRTAPVFRVEVRLRSRQLRSLKTRKLHAQVANLQDWFAHRRRLLTYVVTKSLRFYLPPFNVKHAYRSKLLPCWSMLTDFIATNGMFHPVSLLGRSTTSLPTVKASVGAPGVVSTLAPIPGHQRVTWTSMRKGIKGSVVTFLAERGLPVTSEYHAVIMRALDLPGELSAFDIEQQVLNDRSTIRSLAVVQRATNPEWRRSSP